MDRELLEVMTAAPDHRLRETTWCMLHQRLEAIAAVAGVVRFEVERTTKGGASVLTRTYAHQVSTVLACGCLKTMIGGDWWRPSR